MLKKISLGVICTYLMPGFALTPVSVALDWYINPDHAPLLAAETQGYFAENNLDVELIEPAETSEARDLVAAHQATFGIDYEPETLIAISKGLPIKMIGSLVNSPLSCITVLQSSSIHSLADLRGKTLGYSGNNIEKEFLEAELQHAGLALGAVTLVPIHMNLSQALLAHTVDAVAGMMRNVEPVMLHELGIQTRLFFPEQNGIPNYSELVVISRTDEDPAISSAFLKALGEGAAYVKAHPELSWQTSSKIYAHQLATSAQISAENHTIWLISAPYFNTHPAGFDLASEQKFKAFLLKAGLIENM